MLANLSTKKMVTVVMAVVVVLLITHLVMKYMEHRTQDANADADAKFWASVQPIKTYPTSPLPDLALYRPTSPAPGPVAVYRPTSSAPTSPMLQPTSAGGFSRNPNFFRHSPSAPFPELYYNNKLQTPTEPTAKFVMPMF